MLVATVTGICRVRRVFARTIRLQIGVAIVDEISAPMRAITDATEAVAVQVEINWLGGYYGIYYTWIGISSKATRCC